MCLCLFGNDHYVPLGWQSIGSEYHTKLGLCLVDIVLKEKDALSSPSVKSLFPDFYLATQEMTKV